MARFSVPAAPAVYTTSYKDFKGVDYRPEEVSVDRNRFSDCRNIVFDKSGFPEKRLGWRKLNSGGGKIYGSCVADVDGVRKTFLHMGWCLYIFDGEKTTAIKFEGENPISDGHETRYLYKKKSIMFSMNDCIYVINEAGYIVVKKDDDEELKAYNALEKADVPVIFEKRNACYHYASDAYSYYVHSNVLHEEGVLVDKATLVTDKRVGLFAITSMTKTSDPQNSNYGNCRSFGMVLYLGENVKAIEKVEVKVGEGDENWIELTGGYMLYEVTPGMLERMRQEDKDAISFFVGKSLLRISDDWERTPYDLSGAENNLRVTYTVNSVGIEKITKCTKAVKYGVTGEDRVFITGNEEYKNYIWYSDFNNPLYFPDLNYITVGADDKGVLGFSKLSGYLAIHKEDSVDDANLYLVRGELTDEDAIFKVTTGIPGVGAISEKGFASIEDEPLFLTKNGVFAIQSTYIAQEKCVASRSGFVNPELEKCDLTNAVMTRWKNYILIAVNDEKGTCFVLNAGSKSYVEDVSSPFYKTFYYESTVWDNIFADEFFLVGDELYFYKNNENDSYIGKFNSDVGDLTRFNDEALTVGAKAIDAYFKTKMDDDGSFMMLKTMVKRGCGVMVKPYTRSSAEIYVITDKEGDKLIKTASAGMLDFSDLDFSLISFNTRDIATIIPLNTKVKKYSTLQFMVRNNEKSQGMGVLGIEKRYKVGNYKKY